MLGGSRTTLALLPGASQSWSGPLATNFGATPRLAPTSMIKPEVPATCRRMGLRRSTRAGSRPNRVARSVRGGGVVQSFLNKGQQREDTARIINAFVLRVARVEFRPWFEYIPSAQNIADLPSRAKWAEYYEVIGADAQGRRADGSAASVFVPMVLPDFATWAAPVAQLAPSSKRRRGVRGGRGR